ncbi:putative reverse transcriptase zinc-binding domain-containing protein [Helianthus annuus]|uniref:Reverse transcriptase zinc-binding domain-containing protein n=1 Tax=Helianthus annuus TaxID=4232 RepID=A0A9K3E8S3_HELAN|nr:putative reverse transcriptase zinc-binding domain-containing protein [Helianthus annuus]KAJ0839583.1 putative reverse transcriptase zinc-binding domain-containing protein [Helianthus annuus]
MIKWVFRFKNEPSSLWARFITAIHDGGRCHSFIPLISSIGGVWKSIVNLGRISQNQSFNVQERIVLKLGNGRKTLFWLDVWAGDRPLRELFPNLYDLESEKRCYVSERYTIHQGSIEWFWGSSNSLLNANQTGKWAECISLVRNADIQTCPDVWLWKSGSEVDDYMVSTVRAELDHIDTINETKVLKWLHWIPKKVNCFLWRVVLDRIATREALLIRRISLPSTQCIFCNNTVE